MAQYLVIKNNNNSTKQYECKDSPIGAPYLKVNSKAIDLTTKTSARFDLCVKPKVTSIKEQISSEYTYNTTDYNGYSGLGLATLTTGYYGYTKGNKTTGYTGVTGFKGTITSGGVLTSSSVKVNNTYVSYKYWSITSTSSNYYAGTSYTLPNTYIGTVYAANPINETRFYYITSPMVSYSRTASTNVTFITSNINYAQKSFGVYITIPSGADYAYNPDYEYFVDKTTYRGSSVTEKVYSSSYTTDTAFYSTTALTTTGDVYITSSTTKSDWTSTGALTTTSYVNTTKTNFMFLNNASNITNTTKRTTYGYSTATKTANTSMVYRPVLYSNKNLEKVSESTVSYSGNIKTTSSYIVSISNYEGYTVPSTTDSSQTTTSYYSLYGTFSKVDIFSGFYSKPATSSASYIYSGTFSVTTFYNNTEITLMPLNIGTGTLCNFTKTSAAGTTAGSYEKVSTSYTITDFTYCSGTIRSFSNVGYPYTSIGGYLADKISIDWVNGKASWQQGFLGSAPDTIISASYSFGNNTMTYSNNGYFSSGTYRYYKVTCSSSGLIYTSFSNSKDFFFRPEDIVSSSTNTGIIWGLNGNLTTSSKWCAFYDNGTNYTIPALKNIRTNYVTSSSYVTLKSTAAATNNMSNTYAFVKTYNNNLGTTLITY